MRPASTRVLAPPADYPGMTRALVCLLAALLLVRPATAVAKRLVGTPGKDRLVGNDKATSSPATAAAT